MSVLLDMAFVSVGAAIGAAAGWWIRGSSSPPPAPEMPPPQAEEKPEFDDVESLMSRLHQITESVAADVGEHNQRVQEISDELSSGDDEVDVVTMVERLIDANGSLQSQLSAAETRMQAQSQEIEHHIKEACTDPLTKLANRRCFDNELARCLDEFERNGRPASLMMADLDHFKIINDTFGHPAGDEILRGISRLLMAALPENEIVCRYGGEEFAVIFPGADLETAKVASERARAAIGSATFEYEGMDLRVTASSGIAQFIPEETTEQLIMRADGALYASKEQSRDCGHWHDGMAIYPISKTCDVGPNATAQEELAIPSPTKDEGSDIDTKWRGLACRDTFSADVNRRISEWQHGGSGLAVLLIEIDEFHEFCEHHGPAAREVILRAAGAFLEASVGEMDHVARFEDHVFAILLPGGDLNRAMAVADQVRAAARRFQPSEESEDWQFTVSLGSAEIAGGDEMDTLLNRAWTSLLAAKTAGGDCGYLATKERGCQPMALALSS